MNPKCARFDQLLDLQVDKLTEVLMNIRSTMGATFAEVAMYEPHKAVWLNSHNPCTSDFRHHNQTYWIKPNSDIHSREAIRHGTNAGDLVESHSEINGTLVESQGHCFGYNKPSA